ncbi:MAG: AAA domain-containing protein [Thermoanaerobaculia bacterium]
MIPATAGEWVDRTMSVSALDDGKKQTARSRLKSLFRFIRDLHVARNPITTEVSSHPWMCWWRDLPAHESVTLGQESEDDDYLLRIRRPARTNPPPPPESLRSWLQPGWDDPESEPAHRAKEWPDASGPGSTLPASFTDEPSRVAAWHAWLARWRAWAEKERPARKALQLFGQFYDLYGRLEREGEQFELLLGDGILRAANDGQSVEHPVLNLRVELEFEPSVPMFLVRDSGKSPDLVGSVIQRLPEAESQALETLRTELEAGQFHPLGAEDTSGFLKSLIHRVLPTKGEFLEDRQVARTKVGPVLYRDAVLFLRKKVPGIAEMASRIVDDLESRDDVASGLERIVGVDRNRGPSEPLEGARQAAMPQVDILLSKPANAEQVRIVEQLERNGCVLVQGPPGTGKSHTIGNLIGHLLAQGKSVLVTAHTIKSLRVLRSLVEKEIQSLCLSVLDTDLASRSALEESVAEIVRRLGEDTDGSSNLRIAEQLAKQRGGIKRQLQAAETELREARADEHRQIVVGGAGVAPAEAAREVKAAKGSWEWLPPGLKAGAALPLSAAEVDELYRSNILVSASDEADLAGPLPPPDLLVLPEELARHLRHLRDLQAADRSFGRANWDLPSEPSVEELDGLLLQLTQLATGVIDLPPWQRSIAAVGTGGQGARAVWASLIRQIEEFGNVAETTAELRLSHGPVLAAGMSSREQCDVAAEVAEHLEQGGTLGFLTGLLHSSWQRLQKAASVRSGEPSTAAHFRALEAEARFRTLYGDLAARWKSQVTAIGGPPAEPLGPATHRVFSEFAAQIMRSLDWHANTWKPLEQQLLRLGFRVSEVVEARPPMGGPDGSAMRLAGAVIDVISPSVSALRADVALLEATRVLGGFVERGATWSRGPLGQQLLRALVARDASAYAAGYARREELERKAAALLRRKELLGRVAVVAPEWAAAIEARAGAHGGESVPGSVVEAWKLRQWAEELDRRAKKDLDALQRRVRELRDEELKVTAALVERRAWASQIRKTDLTMKQALIGWEQTIKRIGKGTGKRAPKLRREAQRLMEQAVGSVPVWIMPLTRVAEQFDPRSSRFDVVIIDEASQSDVMALTALYLGREIVVVGDDEQVSPDAVGQDVESIEKLIDEHLRDVPNRQNFDGKLSVYDLAKSSFGGTLTLREHFRCVPEIIQFSNLLSYPGAKSLVPLRDPSRVTRRPFVVPYRVEAGSVRSKVNEAEAQTIAALIVSALAEPEYGLNESGRPISFGVISLVGEEQAYFIDNILRQRISPREYERRRVLCGNAAQFQGDERDVIFLSMVDVSDGGGPLALRQDDRFKKRFNVAVSRARDQLWVVYSLNPDTDLKAGDLRHRLICHALNPAAAVEELRRGECRVQSEFERLVLQDLAGRGYRVTSQFQVGRYSIDLAVECDGRRMAVECDGDRYHNLENLDDDMRRQALLERLGWRFVRIRGSAFFRDPEGTMGEVVARLKAAEIYPTASAPEEAPTSDLLQRVTTGAQEVLAAWREPEEEPDDPAEPPVVEEPNGRSVATARPSPDAPAKAAPEGAKRGAGDLGFVAAGWISDYESVVVLLRTKGSIANRDVQTLLGVAREDAMLHLRRLVREGRAVQVGSKRGTRYQLAGADRESDPIRGLIQ